MADVQRPEVAIPQPDGARFHQTQGKCRKNYRSSIGLLILKKRKKGWSILMLRFRVAVLLAGQRVREILPRSDAHVEHGRKGSPGKPRFPMGFLSIVSMVGFELVEKKLGESQQPTRWRESTCKPRLATFGRGGGTFSLDQFVFRLLTTSRYLGGLFLGGEKKNSDPDEKKFLRLRVLWFLSFLFFFPPRPSWRQKYRCSRKLLIPLEESFALDRRIFLVRMFLPRK